MTTGNLWPEVADALAELNESARTALRFPVPGDWVRQAWQGMNDRVPLSPTWHIARGTHSWDPASEWQRGVTHVVRPLCGRDIWIEPRQSDLIRIRAVDIRDDGATGDKECWHCLRKQRLLEGDTPA